MRWDRMHIFSFNEYFFQQILAASFAYFHVVLSCLYASFMLLYIVYCYFLSAFAVYIITSPHKNAN